ncbi:hypothetical protein NGM37_36200, partial [Streptomyces sp. TRM76130]|nr:hypothetical protein [Streptomyces sp. TRM76130]
MRETGWSDHSPAVFPAGMSRPCSARLGWSWKALQVPLFTAVSRRFQSKQKSFQPLRGPAAARLSRRPRAGLPNYVSARKVTREDHVGGDSAGLR